MKLKTLKDLVKETMKEAGIEKEEDCLIDWEELKQEAIKWVKEDLKDIENNPLLRVEESIGNRLIQRWMRRFNITEEDLR